MVTIVVRGTDSFVQKMGLRLDFLGNWRRNVDVPMILTSFPADSHACQHGVMTRYGMTIPLGGPLHTQKDRISRLPGLGYTDVWSAEGVGPNGFIPLALASEWAPELRLGTAIIPAYTRGPALLADTVGTMAQAAPGRFVLGIGTSSNVIVENWNSIPFVDPYKRVKDMVAFLREALSGEKVTNTYDSFDVKGYRCQVKPAEEVPIFVAALREGMLKLAGRVGDGVIVNWLSAEDLNTVVPIVTGAANGEPREIVARLFVAPTEDRETALQVGRFAAAAYLSVPVYKAFHQWIGREEILGGFWERWEDGDRKGALAEIPESVVDDLVINGSYETCRAQIQRYFDNGLTTSALALMPTPDLDVDVALEALSPSAG